MLIRNFKDSEGNEWGIRVDKTMLRIVKEETGVLLTDLWRDDMALLKHLCADVILASDILWLCVAEQAKRREVTQQQFELWTENDYFEDAVYALIESVTDFFPEARQKVLQKLLKLGRINDEQASKKVSQALEEYETKLTRSSSTTSSPESVESTPTPEPSESSPSWQRPSSPMTTTQR